MQESPQSEPTNGGSSVMAFSLIEKSVAHELLEMLVGELREQRRPWMTYTEDEQRESIDRLRKSVENSIEQLTQVIVAGQRQTLTADVDRVTFANSVRAVLTLPRGSGLVHELADRAGAQVVLVLVDPKEFASGLDQVRPDTPQIDLLGGDDSPPQPS